MRKVNEVTVCRNNYKNEADWYQAIGDMVVNLIRNRQIVVVRMDEPSLGIVDIEFDYDDLPMGAPYPYWLTEEERESVIWED